MILSVAKGSGTFSSISFPVGLTDSRQEYSEKNIFHQKFREVAKFCQIVAKNISSFSRRWADS